MHAEPAGATAGRAGADEPTGAEHAVEIVGVDTSGRSAATADGLVHLE
ncbi:hypothetical protein LUW77_24990 [Streptomyces radiopugnans]|nr:hypothetical protein LUW77_24990 [Streptomyces radiopugnans]